MKVNQSKAIRIAILGTLACLSQIASAIDLGPISVNSHIGEPLSASILVGQIGPSEAASTSVKIADAGAYQSKGIKKLPSHDKLQLSLVPHGSKYAIQIRSNEQIREPFINFVLSVNSAGQETIREYSVFLDPAPSAIGGVSTAVSTAPASAPPPALPKVERVAVTLAPVPEQIEKPPVNSDSRNLLALEPASPTDSGWQGNRNSSPSVAPKPVPKTTALSSGGWQGKTYGPVKKGETLFSIAEKVRPSTEYSMQAVMQQLFAANRRAFTSNSLGSLMAGYTLSIPQFDKHTTLKPVPEKPVQQTAEPKMDAAATEKESSEENAESVGLNSGEASVDTIEADVSENSAIDADSDADVANSVEPSDSTSALENTAVVEENVDITESSDVVADNLPEDASLQNDALQSTEAVGLTELQSNDSSQSELTANDSQVDGSLEIETADAEASDTHTEQPEDNSISEAVITQTADSELDSVANETVEETEQLTSDTDHAGIEVVKEETVAPEVQPVDNMSPTQTDNVEQDMPSTDAEQNFLMTTYAILPMWQWLLIGLLALLILAGLLYRSRQKKIDSDAVLDQEELDAVLAKINEFEEEQAVHSVDSPDAELTQAELDAIAAIDAEDDDQLAMNSDEVPALDDNLMVDNANTELYEAYDEPTTAEEELNKNDFDFFVDGHDEGESSESAFDDSLLLDTSDKEDLNNTTLATDPELENQDFLLDDFDEKDLDTADSVSSDTSKEEIISSSTSPENMDWLEELNFIEEADIENDIKETVATSQPASTVSAEEMEINLDLATSFIATGHGDRAITWLEEVLEIGTDEQKARAQELMRKARGI